MTPIKEAPREERLERALLAIESLAMCKDDDKDEFVGKVYMIAHAATCHCKSVCRDWISLVEECEKFGKERRIYDAEKILSRTDHD